MPDWPYYDGQLYENTSGAYGQVIQSSTTALTYGSWTTIIAATDFDWQSIHLYLGGGISATNPQVFGIDIGVGSSGSETVLIQDIVHDEPGVARSARSLHLPIHVKKGERVAARLRTLSGALFVPSLQVKCIGGTGGWPVSGAQRSHTFAQPFSSVIGESHTIDPGTSANTKGAYTQLKSSISFDTQWVVVNSWLSNSTTTTCAWDVDIAVGSASNEEIVLPDLGFFCAAAGDVAIPATYCFPLRIPSGTRIAARAACSITDATDRLLNLQLITVG